jgi:hypothetical protein
VCHDRETAESSSLSLLVAHHSIKNRLEIVRVEKNNYCERSKAEPRVLIEPKKNLFRPKKLAALSLSSGVPSLCSLKLSCQKGKNDRKLEPIAYILLSK